MNPQQYCAAKAAASGSSFVSAFRFLPVAQREAMTAVYAYCRELDDIVDDCSDPHVAAHTLLWWRQDLDKAYHGQAEHPVNRALVEAIQKFNLPQDELVALIDGMEMDLRLVRYADFATLSDYCYHVAGVVGRLIARILGFRDVAVLDYADKMGLALQLTNIIRDVGEDARMGRIYLPSDELARFGVSETQILQGLGGKAFEDLMAFQIERAQKTYREALALLPASERRSQRAGLMMAAIYHALLEEIALDGAGNVLKYKLAIPKARKIRIALKTRLFGFNLPPM